MSEMDRAFGWDDTIQNDSSYVVVPEGDYNFRIIGFQRGHHGGSDKIGPCPKAILDVEIWNGPNKAVVTVNLFLHSATEGILCEFFTAIGQRKPGEQLKPRWDQIVGSTGTCKVANRVYNGNTYNDIKKWYPKGKAITQLGSAAPQASVAPSTGYQAGQF
jgi:hypothetical protein